MSNTTTKSPVNFLIKFEAWVKKEETAVVDEVKKLVVDVEELFVKFEPEILKLEQDLVAAYNAAKVAVPFVEQAVTDIAEIIAELESYKAGK